MKLKKIFPFFIAIFALMASCADEATMTLLDEIQVSKSFVTLPLEGGSETITVTAKGNWTAEKVFIMKNDSVVKDSISWLSLSVTTGSAGETELTFSVPEFTYGRKAEVLLKCGDNTQRISVMQGLVKPTVATVAEVNAGPDGKTYRVKGICTSIANTQYGNWNLTDETGTVLIYGTLDKNGGTKNFQSLGIEVGDEITVDGPKTTYNGTVELVDVSVVQINKTLIKVDSVKNSNLPLDGGEFTAYLTCKGQGVSVDIPEDAKDWLTISSIQQAGTNAVVKFHAASLSSGYRNTTLTFKTTDGTKEYTIETDLAQGAIVAPIADFIAAADKNTQYSLTGVVTSITDAVKGRFYLKDFSGEVYVYNMAGFQNLGVKEGDIITIVGKYDAYNNTPEVVSAVLEKSISVTAIGVTELLTKPNSPDVYYMVTGEIKEIQNPTYGNLILKEGDSEILLYGCYPGYGATGDARKNFLATKGIKVGDQLTVIAPKIDYKGTIELSGGIYFSHVSAPQ